MKEPVNINQLKNIRWKRNHNSKATMVNTQICRKTLRGATSTSRKIRPEEGKIMLSSRKPPNVLRNSVGNGQDPFQEVRRDGRRRNIEKGGRLKLPPGVREGNENSSLAQVGTPQNLYAMPTHEALPGPGPVVCTLLKVEISPPTFMVRNEPDLWMEINRRRNLDERALREGR